MSCEWPILTPPILPNAYNVVVLEQRQQVSMLSLRYPSPYANLLATNLPAEQFSGYLSLTILELNIYTLSQRNQLFCTEWSVSIPPHTLPTSKLIIYSCGVPVFANTTSTKCKQCEADVPLRINPRLVRSAHPTPAPSPHSSDIPSHLISNSKT